jgi:hypothetical protein
VCVCVRCNGDCVHTFLSVVLLLFYVMKVFFCFVGLSIGYFSVVISLSFCCQISDVYILCVVI